MDFKIIVSRHAYAAFLGGALSAVNCYFYQWQFWLILVGTVILSEWKASVAKNPPSEPR